jgi:hypothetical protein
MRGSEELDMSRSALVVLALLAIAPSCRTTREEPVGARRERALGTALEPSVAALGREPVPAEVQGSFAGTWNTTYGTMRLRESGTHVAGTYLYAGRSTIEGERAGRILQASYAEPDGTVGRAVFELAEDGASFEGPWRPGLDEPLELDDRNASRWQGTRVVPVAGRIWLVILEAHWEQSLSEHEYSYGEMLRAFFERVPAVEVRHRFFHDRADLERFCHEVAGLVEPVVLYISSHGSPAGVAAGGDTIDGATIGRALADAGAMKLVHFGSCQVLNGDEPGKLLAAAAPHEPFPISGFRASADWAGSAIVDFTYLTLVLEKGLEPAEALRFTRGAVGFAGPPDARGARGARGNEPPPIVGSDLVLWDSHAAGSR